MKKLLMAAAAAALMLGAASASASAEALKACWVYVGPIGDYGYSYQHHQGLLAVQKEFGSFDQYIWQFVNGKPLENPRKSLREIQSRTPESDAMSKDLLKRGFKFVGSTICYAFMQAVGMVNDHETRCFRHKARR